MPVNINITGMNAGETLAELRELSVGLLPVTTPKGDMYATVAASLKASAGSTEPVTAAQPEQGQVEKRPSGRTRAKTEAKKPAISTGEERVGPDETPETEAQDAADEAAETKAEAKVELSHDSIRGALGVYVKKFGMPAAQEDGPKVIAMALGAKADKSAWKISEIPAEQEALKKVLDGVEEMTSKNPFKREPVKAA